MRLHLLTGCACLFYGTGAREQPSLNVAAAAGAGICWEAWLAGTKAGMLIWCGVVAAAGVCPLPGWRHDALLPAPWRVHLLRQTLKTIKCR